MDFFQSLVEERIRKAQEEGLFDNLPGQGKPLKLDDESSIPEDLRMTYKILKNANCLPVEMELRKEIFNLRQLLNAADERSECKPGRAQPSSIDAEDRKHLRRKLNLLILNFNLRHRGSVQLDVPQL